MTLVRMAVRGVRVVSTTWRSRRAAARSAPRRSIGTRPPTLTLPSGRACPARLSRRRTRHRGVKLQESVRPGRDPAARRSDVPVTFELLAPNGRPVQVTSDLRSFWDRGYPDVRRQLRGRYPKHRWPEDPFEP